MGPPNIMSRYHVYSFVLFCLCCHLVGAVILDQYAVCSGCTISRIYYAGQRQIILTEQGLLYTATVNGTNCTKIEGISEVVKLHQYEGKHTSFVARKVGSAFFTHDAFATHTESILPVYSIGYGLIHVAPLAPGVAFFETYLQIYTTSDSGETWNGPYSGSQFEWSLDHASPNNLFMSSLPTRASETTVFSYTSNFGKNMTALFSNVTQTQTFVMTPNYIWLFSKDGSVMVSSVTSDPSHTKVESYKTTSIPATPHFFRLDEGSGNFVATKDIILPVTTIYYSVDNGLTWNVSIENAALSAEATSVSFNKIADGVYLVNVASSILDFETKTTKISYDSGVTWQNLTVIETANATDADDCAPECTLFLRANTANKRAFHTSPYANGVIVAVGTIGSSASEYPVKTYISSNAGRSWDVLVNEETIYEVAGNGSIIVWATVTPTTVIWYSNDTGLTKQNYTISSVPVYVYNITSDGMGTNFAVFTKHTATTAYLVYAVNIMNPHIPPDNTIGNAAAKAIKVIVLIGLICTAIYLVIDCSPKIKNSIRGVFGYPPKIYEEAALPSH